MRMLPTLLASFLLFVLARPAAADDKDDGWIVLFNGKDLTGWKLRSESYNVIKFVDAAGNEIKGAKQAKVEQKDSVVDSKGKAIAGASVGKIDGKTLPLDDAGKPIPGAKIIKTGGRDAILNAAGAELKDAKAVLVPMRNPTGGWLVKDGALTCGNGPRGVDLFTEQKFGDFQLHVEFLGTGNSGVYLQGRYEIQVDNSYSTKPKIEEVDGKKVEVWSKTMCGALYGQIAPSKNMAKPVTEWQNFDVTFRGARGEKGKVTAKSHLTLVWNGEKVIDADVPNGTALDPGPVLLQGDHGKVSFRNIRIKPLSK